MRSELLFGARFYCPGATWEKSFGDIGEALWSHGVKSFGVSEAQETTRKGKTRVTGLIVEVSDEGYTPQNAEKALARNYHHGAFLIQKNRQGKEIITRVRVNEEHICHVPLSRHSGKHNKGRARRSGGADDSRRPGSMPLKATNDNNKRPGSKPLHAARDNDSELQVHAESRHERKRFSRLA